MAKAPPPPRPLDAGALGFHRRAKRHANHATLVIRDDALWAKHVGEPALRRRIDEMTAGTLLRLKVDGRSITFRKMKDGKDGRPTPGLRVDPDDVAGRAAWVELQGRRGETVPVAIDGAQHADPYLAYLDEFLWEWNTPEDAEAFDDL